MSRLIRFLLAMCCVIVLAAPAGAGASRQTGPSRPGRTARGPGGIAAARFAAQVQPQPSTNSAAGASTAAAPEEARSINDWSRIVYQSAGSESWDIFTMRPDGSDVRAVVTGPADDGRPQLSPAAARVAFISDRSGNFDIYTVAPDGSALRQLTAHPAEDNYPAWSPDGSRIAFASTRSGSWDILLMNADGSGVVPFTSGPETDFGPAWSPDGRSIAWIRYGTETGRVWLANADGSNARAISDDLRFLENLAWSPDGQRIAFDFDYGWDGFNEAAYLPTNGTSTIETLIQQPRTAGSDVLMNGYAPDGSMILLSLVEYVLINDELLIDRAVLAYKQWWEGTAYSPTELPGSGLDMNGHWQKVDYRPPSSSLNPPPKLAFSNVFLSWSGSDSESRIEYYDLEYRIGAGPWEEAYHSLTGTDQMLTFSAGDVVSFRVRARDAAGNVEPWPSSPNGEGTTTFYASRYTGFVFDVRETPIPGVRIEGASWPDIPWVSAADGGYDLYSFGGIYSLQAADDAYGTLPAIPTPAGQGARYDIVLPPKADAVQNGGFEDPDNWVAGWLASSLEGIQSTAGAPGMHSGARALSLGRFSLQGPASASISQPVVVPAAANHPTLSFFVQVITGSLDGLTVSLTPENGTPALAALHRTEGGLWTHAWADLSQWAGQTVMLTFTYAQPAGFEISSITLDEITVGEWHTPYITEVEAVRELPGELVVRGGNFEPGASVRLDATVLATIFIDAGTLRATVPVSTPPGGRALWVRNPGGEEALSTVRIGSPVFVPLITKN